MLKFVIDEDMPRSTGRIIKKYGYDVMDVRDYALTQIFASQKLLLCWKR
jgi:hypothetical protein